MRCSSVRLRWESLWVFTHTRSAAAVTCLVMQQKAAYVKPWHCHKLCKGRHICPKVLFKQKTEAWHTAEIVQLQIWVQIKEKPVIQTHPLTYAADRNSILLKNL